MCALCAALEQGDLAEFNPCLALLQQLYAENVWSSSSAEPQLFDAHS